MTESNSPNEENPETVAFPAGSLPEELPPVQPPSAGYIIQLFLIPALIVAAVIGVWALFGKLADSETDLDQLVVELGSSNENRRWRAALGLAQVLRNQQIAPDTNGVALARQPKVAAALSDLLQKSMDSKSTNDKEVKNQEFLARTLGALEADDVVLPMLAKALASDKNIEVRKSSLMSLAMIAGRHFESQAQAQTSAQPGTADEIPALDAPLSTPTITEESVTEQLKLAAQDPAPAVRHLAAFVLGLVSGQSAVEQLEVMLLDGDPMTRANAAVALARNGQVQGVPVLLAMLTDGTTELSREDFGKLTPEEQQLLLQHRQFEQPIILRNCIRAVESLWEKIDEASQTELKAVLGQLSDSHSAAGIRVQAQALLNQM
ncbi:MAG: HEAT repeat domain-containing protein [Fuerstiella sp.]|nr:HEAT repeat domain-containing protein [Fuerstiella sp.]MCP4853649.1 HEAT repeat domain-containing protein [Fuerstiella sp.]